MNTALNIAEHVAPASLRSAPGANAAFLARDARAGARVGAALAAMVRTQHGESIGYIRNLSSRGLMLSTATPLQRGEFIEIVTKSDALVGRVQWVQDGHAGIALRDSIDVDALKAGTGGHVSARPTALRKASRLSVPGRAAPSAAAIFHDSQMIARQLQFAAVLAIGACAALLVALSLHDLLTEVIQNVRTGLPQ